MFEGNPQAPATKSDLQLVKSEPTDEIQSLEGCTQTRLEPLVSEKRDWLSDIRDSQAELLKVIYSFTQNDSRHSVEFEGSEAALRGRLGIIEDRLLEVEKRLNIPLVN